jgi:hypothetical protein
MVAKIRGEAMRTAAAQRLAVKRISIASTVTSSECGNG